MSKNKQQKRASYLSVDDLPLRKTPIVIYGYAKDRRFVCRLHINAAGVAAYSGTNGNKLLRDWSWEKFVSKLSNA